MNFKPIITKGGTSTYLTPIYNAAITLSKEHEDFSKVMNEKINKKIIEIKREHETKYRVKFLNKYNKYIHFFLLIDENLFK